MFPLLFPEVHDHLLCFVDLLPSVNVLLTSATEESRGPQSWLAIHKGGTVLSSKPTILPILEFGDVIYKIASNTLLSKLDAIYHSAICFVSKAPYTTLHCDLYALVDWPLLHIHHQTHWLRVIYKSLLGKAPPYSLVTIAAPTRSTCSSRYISLVTPKANSYFGRLPFQFSADNDWNELQKSLKLETYIKSNIFI